MTATMEQPLETAIVTRLCDLSHYQNLITLAFIQANNIKGVAAKCTEDRTYVDPHYATNHARVRSYGLPFWAYHFMHPEQVSAIDSADFFLAHAALKAGDRILMDAEASGLGQSATNTWLKAWADRVIARSPANPADIYLSGGYCGNGTGTGLAKFYHRLWYPRYNTTGWPTTWSPGFSASWEDNTGFHPAPDVHQCDTSSGFDHDVTYMTITELIGGTVALTQADIDNVANAVVAKLPAAVWDHLVDAPSGYGYTAKQYAAHNFLAGGDAHGKKAVAQIEAVKTTAAALGQSLDAVKTAVAALGQPPPVQLSDDQVQAVAAAVATAVSGQTKLDPAALAAALATELSNRLAS